MVNMHLMAGCRGNETLRASVGQYFNKMRKIIHQ